MNSQNATRHKEIMVNRKKCSNNSFKIVNSRGNHACTLYMLTGLVKRSNVVGAQHCRNSRVLSAVPAFCPFSLTGAITDDFKAWVYALWQAYNERTECGHP